MVKLTLFKSLKNWFSGKTSIETIEAQTRAFYIENDLLDKDYLCQEPGPNGEVPSPPMPMMQIVNEGQSPEEYPENYIYPELKKWFQKYYPKRLKNEKN